METSETSSVARHWNCTPFGSTAIGNIYLHKICY